MAIKVTKGQISDGTMLQNTCHEEYYLYGKFHSCMKKCTILSILVVICCYTKGEDQGVDTAVIFVITIN